MVDATPDTIWPFLTEPDKHVEWNGTGADIDPRSGGVHRVLIAGQFQSAGECVEVVPNEKIVFTFGWEQTSRPIPPGWTTMETTGTWTLGVEAQTYSMAVLGEGAEIDPRFGLLWRSVNGADKSRSGIRRFTLIGRCYTCMAIAFPRGQGSKDGDKPVRYGRGEQARTPRRTLVQGCRVSRVRGSAGKREGRADVVTVALGDHDCRSAAAHRLSTGCVRRR
jgi:uncharacterized protein YndB with AHSA1/START domain